MIEASVMRTVWNDGKTGYEVKAKGHAGAGKYGQDIVCAAVSCLMQTLANEVEEAARAGLVALGAVAHGEGWWSWYRTDWTRWPRVTRRTWSWW